MSESKPFKEFLDRALVEDLVRRITAVWPAFSADAFLGQVLPNLDALELKARSALIAAALHDHLPEAFPEAARILVATLDPAAAEVEGITANGWIVMPIEAFVGQYGLDHFEESMTALHAITQRFTAEFAIRPFLQREPERTLALLQTWARDESEHVRRLVSEGTRTRLPWAPRLPAFMADPAPVLLLLEMLKDDPSLYVRRSVANNLNDIAKDHPDLVIATLERWAEDASEERRWVIRHALRTLVKQGHPAALALLGAGEAEVVVETFGVDTRAVRIGDSLTINLTLRSVADREQHLVIDYTLHLMGANGRPRRKVFKLRALALAPGASLRVQKQHSFKPVTVRRYYPGAHRIDLQVNGQVLAGVDFEVVA